MATIKNTKNERKEFPNNPRLIPEQVQKHHKSPRLSRFITESLPLSLKHQRSRKIFWSIFVSLLLLITLITSWDLQKTIIQKNQLDQKRQTIQIQIAKAKRSIYQHPDYRDGYFMLATLEYQLGNDQEAKKYTEKTIALDPNFKPAQTLEKLLQIKTIGEQ